MRLLRETLTNFKGIRSFSFETGGGNISIQGENGTGKTTLFDAFLWVLFDKDSAGHRDFELKTLDADGKAIPMIDHSVELVLDLDGASVSLKKSLSESWVRSRGAAKAEFSGHRSTYEIDGVPRQKKEFDAFISHLCDESLLRILTDPDYFPGILPWQERRKALLELSGGITDDDVIVSEVSLAELSSLLGGKTVEDFRDILTSRKTAVNEEIKTLPVRIDEATRSLPTDVSFASKQELPDEGKLRGELQEVEGSLLALSQGGATIDRKFRLQQIEMSLMAARSKAAAEKQGELFARNREQNAKLCRKESLGRNHIHALERMKQWAVEGALLETQLEKKRNEWNQVNAEEPVFDESDSCPTCGQLLPVRQLQEVREKAQADFIRTKTQKLEQISVEGQTLVGKQANAMQEKQILEQSLPAMESEIETLSAELGTLQAEIDMLQKTPEGEPPEEHSLLQEKAKLSAEIENLAKSSEPERARLLERRDSLRQTLAGISQNAARTAQMEAGGRRITELKAREEALAAEYAELERQIFLTEEFIRVKVSLLESKINSRFRIARFRLFEQQVNGALNEVCEVLGPELVPYNSGLNNAARINTGIDIINTLSEHIGFRAPIFVDNAEAVTQLTDTPAQVIRLVVSDGVKAMTIHPDTAAKPVGIVKKGPGF